MTSTLDVTRRYRANGWPGVALRIHGYPKRWEPYTALVEDPETGEEYEEETGDGEWVEGPHRGRVIVVMVGDNHKYEVDERDLTPLDDGEYCLGCGQIGCTALSPEVRP